MKGWFQSRLAAQPLHIPEQIGEGRALPPPSHPPPPVGQGPCYRILRGLPKSSCLACGVLIFSSRSHVWLASHLHPPNCPELHRVSDFTRLANQQASLFHECGQNARGRAARGKGQRSHDKSSSRASCAFALTPRDLPAPQAMTANTGHHAAGGSELAALAAFTGSRSKAAPSPGGPPPHPSRLTPANTTQKVILHGQSLALFPGPQRHAGRPPDTILSLNLQVT